MRFSDYALRLGCLGGVILWALSVWVAGLARGSLLCLCMIGSYGLFMILLGVFKSRL